MPDVRPWLVDVPAGAAFAADGAEWRVDGSHLAVRVPAGDPLDAEASFRRSEAAEAAAQAACGGGAAAPPLTEPSCLSSAACRFCGAGLMAASAALERVEALPSGRLSGVAGMMACVHGQLPPALSAGAVSVARGVAYVGDGFVAVRRDALGGVAARGAGRGAWALHCARCEALVGLARGRSADLAEARLLLHRITVRGGGRAGRWLRAVRAEHVLANAMLRQWDAGGVGAFLLTCGAGAGAPELRVQLLSRAVRVATEGGAAPAAALKLRVGGPPGKKRWERMVLSYDDFAEARDAIEAMAARLPQEEGRPARLSFLSLFVRAVA